MDIDAWERFFYYRYMQLSLPEYPDNIKQRIRKYYKAGYALHGRPPGHIEESIRWRLCEERVEMKRVIELQKLLQIEFGRGQRHLIVGGGTGGLAVVLHLAGCNVFSIEPDPDAWEIVQLKADYIGMPKENHQRGVAEDLPFKHQVFNFIHCFTVLEHVRDVERTLDEMIRVLDREGSIWLNCPDYRYPYERHYKMLFPTFMPRFIGTLYLKMMRRPPNFWKTINKVTGPKIDRLLCKRDVVWLRLRRPLPANWFPPQRKLFYVYRFFRFRLGIPAHQEILIRILDSDE